MTHIFQFKYMFIKWRIPSVGRRHTHVCNLDFIFSYFHY